MYTIIDKIQAQAMTSVIGEYAALFEAKSAIAAQKAMTFPASVIDAKEVVEAGAELALISQMLDILNNTLDNCVKVVED